MTQTASIPAGAGTEAPSRPSPRGTEGSGEGPVSNGFEALLSGQIESAGGGDAASTTTRGPADGAVQDPPAAGPSPEDGAARSVAAGDGDPPSRDGAPLTAGSANSAAATPDPAPAVPVDPAIQELLALREPGADLPAIAVETAAHGGDGAAVTESTSALAGAVAAPVVVAAAGRTAGAPGSAAGESTPRAAMPVQAPGAPSLPVQPPDAPSLPAQTNTTPTPGTPHSPAGMSIRTPDVAVADARGPAIQDMVASLAGDAGSADTPAATPRPLLAPVAPAATATGISLEAAASVLPRRQVLETPMSSAAWGTALGARMVWNVSNGVSSASLEINPRDLGPVSVALSVQDNEVSLQFSSQHAPVRDAIEAALPRLREQLAAGGFELTGVAVGTDPRGDGGRGESASREGGMNGAPEETADEQRSGSAVQVRLTDGLVDTFA